MEQDIPLESVTPTAFDGPPYTTSDRLQGSSKNPRPILWLFPDGVASAASYTPLPAIAPVMLVHALDCPCLNTPPDLRCPSPQYALKFIPEIRLQPIGPYHSVSWLRLLSSLQDRARRRRSAAGTQSSSKQIYESELLDMFAMSGHQPAYWLRSYFTAFVTVLDQYRPVTPYP